MFSTDLAANCLVNILSLEQFPQPPERVCTCGWSAAGVYTMECLNCKRWQRAHGVTNKRHMTATSVKRDLAVAARHLEAKLTERETLTLAHALTPPVDKDEAHARTLRRKELGGDIRRYTKKIEGLTKLLRTLSKKEAA